MYSSISYLFVFLSFFLFSSIPVLNLVLIFSSETVHVEDRLERKLFLLPKSEFVSDSSLDMSVVIVMMTKGHVFAIVQSDHIFLPNPVHVSFPRLVFFDCLFLSLSLSLI